MKLYNRNQHREESVDEYAEALITYILDLIKVQPAMLAERESALKERFAGGVEDSLLRRELKRLNTERPTLKFAELRECARCWVDDTKQQRSTRSEEIASSEGASGLYKCYMTSKSR